MNIIIGLVVGVVLTLLLIHACKRIDEKNLNALKAKRERLVLEGRTAIEVVNSLDKEIKRLGGC